MDARSFEERAGVLDDSTNGVACRLQGKCHVKLSHSMRRWLEGLHFQPRQLQPGFRRVLPGEHHLKQSTVGQAAHRLGQFYHLLEGDILMPLCRE